MNLAFSFHNHPPLTKYISRQIKFLRRVWNMVGFSCFVKQVTTETADNNSYHLMPLDYEIDIVPGGLQAVSHLAS